MIISKSLLCINFRKGCISVSVQEFETSVIPSCESSSADPNPGKCFPHEITPISLRVRIKTLLCETTVFGLEDTALFDFPITVVSPKSKSKTGEKFKLIPLLANVSANAFEKDLVIFRLFFSPI